MSGVSAFKNAIRRRVHKERAQPYSRKKMGLLEKKSDYKLRAKDYHRKEVTNYMPFRHTPSYSTALHRMIVDCLLQICTSERFPSFHRTSVPLISQGRTTPTPQLH